MDQIRTSWSDPEHAASRPKLIVDSYMFKPGEIVSFAAPGVSVVNVGSREAAVYLRADGLILTDRVPIIRSAMPAATATWISKNVLSRTYLKSVGGVKLARLCSCQYGDCGYCGSGDHDKCTTRVGFNGNPPGSPATYVVDRKGSAHTPVWTSGKPCRWVCPCSSCATAEKPGKLAAKAYRRVSDGVMRPGDTVWLTPKTLGAPAICWKRPRATVVSLSSDLAYAVVAVDGVEHRIHLDNIRFSDPAQQRPRASTPRPRRAMAAGYEETPLF